MGFLKTFNYAYIIAFEHQQCKFDNSKKSKIKYIDVDQKGKCDSVIHDFDRFVFQEEENKQQEECYNSRNICYNAVIGQGAADVLHLDVDLELVPDFLFIG